MPDTAAPASVTVTLGGKPYVLTASVNIMRPVSRLAGGLLPLFRAVANLDGDAMGLIVAAGSHAEPRDVDAITYEVYRHGVGKLVDPLTRFLGLCADGERAPAPAPVDGMPIDLLAAARDASAGADQTMQAKIVSQFGGEPKAPMTIEDMVKAGGENAPRTAADPALH